ncbi:apoptosis-antagonizing transcription factor [Lasiosphaeria hispida]|uniref:Protein BFR2 n=1 Tax=Lasiosphaeria hispida TaxID=260671 RepID=A0AAJ0HFI3_9PEZI|nr:apoptosis-antagonizing transcription factor [Lasiosphaeria hispida]
MPPVEKRRRIPSRLAEWEEKPIKDFDIENEAPDENENSDSDDSADERAGTEHYVAVGKSKIRGKDVISLGPEYRGARVSRAALEESSDGEDDGEDGEEEGSEQEGSNLDDESGSEEFADLDTADLEADYVDDDASITSDNVLCESDEENLKGFTFRGSKKPLVPLNGRVEKRATAADFMTGSEDEDMDGDGSQEEEDDEDDLSAGEDESDVSQDGVTLFDNEAEDSECDDDDDDEDEDEDDDEEGDGDGDEDEDEDKEEGGSNSLTAKLSKVLIDEKGIVDTMAQAAKVDASKGAAVRVQRRAFDAILNIRIRLQKAMVATNSFGTLEDSSDASTEPYQAAEEAAVKLWNTIDSVRHSFLPEGKAKAGLKRKRGIDVDTSTQAIWESMESMEKLAMAQRQKTLDKWSGKVRSAAVSERRLGENKSQSLVSVLDEQLLNMDRFVKRARTPRSCAPIQAAKKVEEDVDIYDDADFYQLLLKELVDQRSVDSGVPGESVATVRWAAIKEAKTRKQLDRRASKGRKLRFTVHEKIQNFMAPEDRRVWEEHAIDRFFNALFGQKMELKEDEMSDEEMGGVSVEEEGLRLFRS